jgi:hypothetical protein
LAATLRTIVVALVATPLLTPPALALEPRTHDGFLLRLSAGAGRAETTNIAPPEGGGDVDESVTASGTSADLNVAIGGMISPNVAIHATLWGWGVPSPETTVGGDASLSMSAVGAGLTYWFLPANIYVSPSLGFGTLSLQQGRNTITTDSGFALDATIGKEWWASDQWGLGFAASASYHAIPDESRVENWTGLGFGLRLSATMN